MLDRRRCLTFDCENYSDAGVFVGELCGPCHHMITTGAIHRQNPTFIGALKRRVFEQGEQLRAIKKIVTEEKR